FASRTTPNGRAPPPRLSSGLTSIRQRAGFRAILRPSPALRLLLGTRSRSVHLSTSTRERIPSAGSERRAACTSAVKLAPTWLASRSLFFGSVLPLREASGAGAWTSQTPSFCRRQKGYSG